MVLIGAPARYAGSMADTVSTGWQVTERMAAGSQGALAVPTAGDSHVEDQAAGTERPTALVTIRRAAHAGFVTEPTGAEVRATAADAARQARAVLAALADPDDELTASAATRHRLEGAVLALDAVSRG